jgi:NADH dehydrogenase
MLGRPVAARLHSDGYTVRVLARDPGRARSLLGPGYEYTEGNVAGISSLRAALEGCTGVHISLKAGASPGEAERVEHQGTARLAAAAAQAGVERVTYLSGCYVSPGLAGHSEAEKAKLAGEQAVRQSGVPYTIFKPTYFMESLALHVQGRVAVVLGHQPHQLRMVAAADYAAMVSRAFRVPGAAGTSLFVFGPEPVSIPDALRFYCRAVGGGQPVITVPLPVMDVVNRAFMRGALSREISLMRLMQRVGEPAGGADAGDVLGAATTTLAQWCAGQADAGEGTSPSSGGAP